METTTVITQEELNKKIDEHKLWLAGKGGNRLILHNANLRNADLRHANLSYADLHNANLYNADLYNADLYNANLYNANLDLKEQCRLEQGRHLDN